MYPETDQTSADSMGQESSDQSSEQGDKMEGETALLPKSILGGKKFNVGEEVVLKIVHEYGDEVEVAYAPEKPTEDNESMEGAMKSMDAMATEA